jgi:ubiquinone/menaquinone biosynthesis C-methylase UbiE
MSALFENYSENYDAVVQSSIDFSGLPHDFFMAAKADLLRELVAAHIKTASPNLLDVGCGVGALHPFLRGIFGSISGTDVSSASIAQARTRNSGIDYRTYDGGKLPYDSASFDVATAVCVMHHVPPQDWPAFAAEMRRVVRPGGLVCVIEHNPFNPLTRLAMSRCEFDRDAVLLPAGKTRRLMQNAGFTDVASRYFLLLPTAHALAHRCERAFARLPLGAQYAAWGLA